MNAEAALQWATRESSEFAAWLTPERRDALLRYWELVEKWGVALNLTRRKDPGEWVRADVLDAVLGLGAAGVKDPALRERAQQHGALDIGSGAGFPGLILALEWPEVPVVWVEASMKRVSFLHRLIRTLRLPMAQAVHCRVEDYSAPAAFVCSRATFPWDALEILRPVMHPTGRLAAFVGRAPSDQEWLDYLSPRALQGQRIAYTVPGLEERAIALAWMP